MLLGTEKEGLRDPLPYAAQCAGQFRQRVRGMPLARVVQELEAERPRADLLVRAVFLELAAALLRYLDETSRRDLNMSAAEPFAS